ncbi:PEP-CTERM sorting domain-containing protein [Pontiellaceae bacterium B1224]|nr:PEP-CTERM sorting domain-containing protein [Pontiellaceae bacterium B1224]
MKKSIIIGATAVAAGLAQAATINWGTSVQMYNAADETGFVNTSGDFILGINPTTTADGAVTLNGVTFDNTDVGEITNGVSGTSGITLSALRTAGGNLGQYGSYGSGSFTDADAQTLVSSGIYQASTWTLSGLTSGQEYLLQIMSNDARSNKSSEFQSGPDTNGVGAIIMTYRDLPSAELTGGYVTSTFIADSETQVFSIYGTRDSWNGLVESTAQVNGLQLRAIPEPATLGLVAVFGGGMFFMRRRFKR